MVQGFGFSMKILGFTEALKGVVLPVGGITLERHPYCTGFSGRKPCPIWTCDDGAFLASSPPWRRRISRPYLTLAFFVVVVYGMFHLEVTFDSLVQGSELYRGC
jgi:hypothetical protein